MKPNNPGTPLSSTGALPRLYLTDRVIWLLLLVAALVRIGYNLALHSGGHSPAAFVIDEREYFAAAHVLAEGRGFSFFDTALWVRPPLFVAFLAPFLAVWGTNTVAVTVVQAILSTLTLLPLGALAYRLGGTMAARWAVGIGAIYLPFTLFAGLLLSETLFLFLFAFTLLALVALADALPTTMRRVIAWSVPAGLLLGLCVLTRSTALAFLPLVAVWLLVVAGRGARRQGLIAAAVTCVVCLMSLAPWVARNYAAYHRIVPVDTTGGYNLWLGSVGVRDEPRLQADLAPLAGPVERQDFALQRAWENIRADPLFFTGKGLKESVDLWRPLFSAEENQISGYTLGRVPAWHLFALVSFGDMLYLALLIMSLFALFVTPPGPLRSLTVLWILLWVFMSFVFFAVTRFRLPIEAVLVPWAGVGVSLLLPYSRDRLSGLKLSPAARFSSLVLLAGILVVVVPAIPVEATRLGAARWSEQAAFRQGEAFMRAGSYNAARESYIQANQALADTRYAMAALDLQRGDTAGALKRLLPDEPADRFEPFIIKGEAARRRGDLQAARTLFNTRVVREAGDAALVWAWDHLDPPPVDTVEVGSGLDIGYVKGFYAPEADENGVAYRWSSGRASIRDVKAAGGPVIAKWSGWRPEALPLASVEVAAPQSGSAGAQTAVLKNDRQWGQTQLNTSSPSGKGTTQLDFTTNPFVPGGSDPRMLGVRLARVGK